MWAAMALLAASALCLAARTKAFIPPPADPPGPTAPIDDDDDDCGRGGTMPPDPYG